MHEGERACASLYAERIAQAEEWTQRNIGFAASLPQAADEGLFAGLANAGADGDRRSLFTDMISQLKDAASGTMRERTDAVCKRCASKTSDSPPISGLTWETARNSTNSRRTGA